MAYIRPIQDLTGGSLQNLASTLLGIEKTNIANQQAAEQMKLAKAQEARAKAAAMREKDIYTRKKANEEANVAFGRASTGPRQALLERSGIMTDTYMDQGGDAAVLVKLGLDPTKTLEEHYQTDAKKNIDEYYAKLGEQFQTDYAKGIKESRAQQLARIANERGLWTPEIATKIEGAQAADIQTRNERRKLLEGQLAEYNKQADKYRIEQLKTGVDKITQNTSSGGSSKSGSVKSGRGMTADDRLKLKETIEKMVSSWPGFKTDASEASKWISDASVEGLKANVNGKVVDIAASDISKDAYSRALNRMYSRGWDNTFEAKEGMSKEDTFNKYLAEEALSEMAGRSTGGKGSVSTSITVGNPQLAEEYRLQGKAAERAANDIRARLAALTDEAPTSESMARRVLDVEIPTATKKAIKSSPADKPASTGRYANTPAIRDAMLSPEAGKLAELSVNRPEVFAAEYDKLSSEGKANVDKVLRSRTDWNTVSPQESLPKETAAEVTGSPKETEKELLSELEFVRQAFREGLGDPELAKEQTDIMRRLGKFRTENPVKTVKSTPEPKIEEHQYPKFAEMLKGNEAESKKMLNMVNALRKEGVNVSGAGDIITYYHSMPEGKDKEALQKIVHYQMMQDSSPAGEAYRKHYRESQNAEAGLLAASVIVSALPGGAALRGLFGSRALSTGIPHVAMPGNLVGHTGRETMKKAALNADKVKAAVNQTKINIRNQLNSVNAEIKQIMANGKIPRKGSAARQRLDELDALEQRLVNELKKAN